MSIVFVFKDIFMGMKKEMVPMARLELARLAPPPPQDGVSTKFHTSAILISIEVLANFNS